MKENPVPDSPAIRQATMCAFFIAGLAMGVWAPLVPYAQRRLELDSSALGLLLLCLGSGSLLSMFLSGRLATRFGCRSVILCGSAIVCLALPLLATASETWLMVVALMIFGAGVGLIDVVVNIQGTIVESHSSRPLMSGFHGAFSVGGLFAAAAVSLLLSLGVTPLLSVVCAIVLIIVLLACYARHLLTYASQEEPTYKPAFKVNARLVIMGVMCMVCFLAEGAALDWSGLWLTTERALPIEHAGWGYAAFGLSMAIIRFTGNRLVLFAGRRRLLIISGFLSVGGYLLVVLGDSWQISLLGFVLVGCGAANVAPLVTSLASTERVMPASMSVSFVATVGYLGILAGPALLGFIAQASGLATAFLFVALVLCMVIFGAFSLKETPAR